MHIAYKSHNNGLEFVLNTLISVPEWALEQGIKRKLTKGHLLSNPVPLNLSKNNFSGVDKVSQNPNPQRILKIFYKVKVTSQKNV